MSERRERIGHASKTKLDESLMPRNDGAGRPDVMWAGIVALAAPLANQARVRAEAVSVSEKIWPEEDRSAAVRSLAKEWAVLANILVKEWAESANG
jgi:hypothetical protein